MIRPKPQRRSGDLEFTTINERMLYTYGVIYVTPSDFLNHCRNIGVSEQTIKCYATRRIENEDRIARGELVEGVIQDMFSSSHVIMAKRKMSCHYLFKPDVYQTVVYIRLTREFIMDRLLVNKFKLTHQAEYQRIINAYNETLRVE